MIACSSFLRLNRLSSAVSVANIPSFRHYNFQDYLCVRSLSNFPILGGKKRGQSSLDKCEKQNNIPVWKPVSTEPEHISNFIRTYSIVHIMDTVNIEDSTPDESTGVLAATLASQVDVIRETPTSSKFNEDSKIVNKGEKYLIDIQVDASLIRFIKGKWGLTQKQIEGETGVKIIFPSVKGESSIVIEGASMENVTRASEKITNILEQAVKSSNVDYSHFVSLPLAIHPELVKRLHSFQKTVLEEISLTPEGVVDGSSTDDSLDENAGYSNFPEHTTVKLEVPNLNEDVSLNIDAEGKMLSKPFSSPALGIDRSIFIKPQTFHLTVLMLKLWNKDLVAMATETLKGVFSKVMDALENQPVSIRLRGLACMKGSPARAHVIYAPIEELGGEGRLIRACQVIIDAFVEAGLVLQKDAHHSLKLHATLMNTRHRKRKKGARRNDSFDARDIFKRYSSKDWGEYVLTEAHLSQRFTFDESGYYYCCASLPFPGNK